MSLPAQRPDGGPPQPRAAAAPATVSTPTLIAAIRAVRRDARRLHGLRSEAMDRMQMDELASPHLADLEEQLLDLSHAGAELRRIYEALQRTSDNLPLYRKLLD